MAEIHNDPRFLDFDALDGLKALTDTVNGEMPEEFTKLVLDIKDLDPDDVYSSVAYERGFNFLMYLERRVGSSGAFLKFFQAYVKEFSYKTLVSDDFKKFFLDYFADNESVKEVNWDAWYYAPGMPPLIPFYDRSLAEASEKLADVWIAVDRNGRMLPTNHEGFLKSWSSGQITCFLDALLSMTEDEPLQLSTVRSMDKIYGFSTSQNSEILFRFCRLAVAAEDESILPVVCRFITSQVSECCACCSGYSIALYLPLPTSPCRHTRSRLLTSCHLPFVCDVLHYQLLLRIGACSNTKTTATT